MKTVWAAVCVSLLLVVPALWAADNLKAFAPAENGMVRYVLQLPAEEDEADLRIELIVGKVVEVDEKKQILFRRPVTGGGGPGVGVLPIPTARTWTNGGNAHGC